jgi:5-methylcytosine-specific restriction endonuclease McrA
MGWQIDHKKPVSLGGTNHRNNLQALNSTQNQSKGIRHPYTYDAV